MRSSRASARPSPTSRRKRGGYSQTSHHAKRRSAFATRDVRTRSWAGGNPRVTSGTGQQLVHPRHRHKARDPVGFGGGHAAAEGRQTVIAAPFVVQIGRRPAARLDNPPVAEHPMQRAVQRARLDLQVALGEACDLLENGVAMKVVARQGEQDVELNRSERHMRGDYMRQAYISTALDERTDGKVVAVGQAAYAGIWTTVLALRWVRTVSGRSFLLRYTLDSALSTGFRSYFTTSNRRWSSVPRMS